MFSTSRRNLLLSLGAGLGPVALSNLLQAEDARSSPLALQPPMFAPRAKRVIMLVMEGGPGHMDTFDPKPVLTQRHKEESQLPGGLEKGYKFFVGSPFGFQHAGDNGI